MFTNISKKVTHMMIITKGDPVKSVLAGDCRPNEVEIFQSPSGYTGGHVPKYTVQITNMAAKVSSVHDIHVACGEFSSTMQVDPKVFLRLQNNDCLVKDGGEMKVGEIISFDYANILPYKLVTSSVEC
ncbi:TPD1 protein 1B-like protein [Cinnamomum micranthum f. kanehirae]|uniref:TPD1 protein 1B-like protein n=1 Tax=Cinnamomum micranthum f. kanehirae TaxID=337451 RepID=A0A3S3NH34_9MAGN|nr:TPD1 protein 1B-like protein [Cinnamomum micranthum f. kanehirae]